MIFYILVVLYVLSMSYILLVEIWYLLSIFICRKKTTCQATNCPMQYHCSKAIFTEEEIKEIQNLLSTLDDGDTDDKI